MKKILLLVALSGLLLFSPVHAEVDLDLIKLPSGFSIDVYAEGVENTRQMARGPGGTLFMGSRRAGKLWALSDKKVGYQVIAVDVLPDGALLVSDDQAGVIYRISYQQ